MNEVNHYKTIKSKIKEVLRGANNVLLIKRNDSDFKEMIDSLNGLSEQKQLLFENHKNFIDSIYQSYNNEKLKFSKYPLVIHIHRQSRELEDYLDDNRRYLTDSDKSQLERLIGGIDDCKVPHGLDGL